MPTPPRSDGPTRFSRRVEEYVRFRPGYPEALIECLAVEHGLRPEQPVADVGSGTGIFSRLLLDRGHVVYAVEPNPEMRAAAERALSAHKGFHSVAGSAERTTLAGHSLDWITVAQAFHWMDADGARSEFRRILRPGGRVALVWNDRRETTPFLLEYERFLLAHGTDYASVRHRETCADGRIEALFGAGRYTRRAFDNRQWLDFEGLRGRTLSASYMPDATHPRCADMLDALRRLFDRHESDGHVTIEYDTRLFVGSL